MISVLLRAVLVVAALALLALVPARAADEVSTYSTSEAPFAEVAQDLNDAIVNRGYAIDYHGFLGDMLKRTAEDVGASETLYTDAQFFTFCSAVLSRKAMEEDISNVAYCPYVLFVYEIAADPGTVRVGFRRLPVGPGRDQVNLLLDEIAREAVGEL